MVRSCLWVASHLSHEQRHRVTPSHGGIAGLREAVELSHSCIKGPFPALISLDSWTLATQLATPFPRILCRRVHSCPLGPLGHHPHFAGSFAGPLPPRLLWMKTRNGREHLLPSPVHGPPSDGPSPVAGGTGHCCRFLSTTQSGPLLGMPRLCLQGPTRQLYSMSTNGSFPRLGCSSWKT